MFIINVPKKTYQQIKITGLKEITNPQTMRYYKGNPPQKNIYLHCLIPSTKFVPFNDR